MREKVQATVTIGEGGTVVIKRSGVSSPTVAQALDIERDEEGSILRIWLDRLVHRVGEEQLDSWRVSGAVSSLLEPAV